MSTVVVLAITVRFLQVSLLHLENIEIHNLFVKLSIDLWHWWYDRFYSFKFSFWVMFEYHLFDFTDSVVWDVE